MRFPLVSVGDIVRAQRALLERLGVRRLAVVTGGSIGGLQALEWAVAYPDFVERAIVLAAGAAPLGAGYRPQRDWPSRHRRRPALATAATMTPGQGPDDGLAIARMAAMLSYTSADDLAARFGRRPAHSRRSEPSFGGAFDVESYLQYQGLKLVRALRRQQLSRFSPAPWTATTWPRGAAPMRRRSAGCARVCWPSASAATGSSRRSRCAPVVEGITAAGGQAQYREINSISGPRRLSQRVGPARHRCCVPSSMDRPVARGPPRPPAIPHDTRYSQNDTIRVAK